MAVTNLTGTKWKINSITCTAGYGQFDILGTAYDQYGDLKPVANIDHMYIGYGLNFDIGFYSRANYININAYPTYLDVGDVLEFDETNAGTDVTNADLISWLQNNAEQLTAPVTDLTGYTWVGNETLSSVGSPFTWMGSSTDQLSLSFTSNGNNYTAFGNYYVTKPFRHQFIGYDSTNAYDYVSGWMDEAYKTILITGGTDVTNTTFISWLESNGTLTEPAGYEVTFVTNGGTSVTKLENVEELPTPLPTTTKANHVFVGWYYDNLFTQKANAGDELTTNVTLYAKWYTPTTWCEDIADAIREKDGTTDPIKHLDFPDKIKNIQGAKELTQAQYDALAVYDDDTYYLIVEDE